MVSLGFPRLVTLINDESLEDLQTFLNQKSHISIDDRDENGTTALMVAASQGKLLYVRELLAHGADVNAEDNDKWTALINAAKEGHIEVISELLNHDARLEHRDCGSWTALTWACYKGRTETVKMLIQHGADVNSLGQFHGTPLLWAAGRGFGEIVRDLLQNGAKANVGDKFGTTPLVWACRKGFTDITRLLINSGAGVDTAGIYSWTALICAARGNFPDIVNLLMDQKPNVNATDKDGCTALTIACKEGYLEIVTSLLHHGAYVNLQDRNGDTNLIHASRAGHKGVVEALLKKYADVNVQGQDKKTALYWAVEKQHVSVAKVILMHSPDIELCTKDGDTALLRAVRVRNVELANLLLDKKAKVSAADKLGDTALHIAMRSRSKAIVELLLRNPHHSKLLYRPNRNGETPYNIDMSNQKTVLSYIYGARHLNANEQNENMLGYDLYSSALADFLSEPSLTLPISVGLYAKWGSGKSFLLNKLREEMKHFGRQWMMEPVFEFSPLVLCLVLGFSILLGLIFGFGLHYWPVGVGVGCASFLLMYGILALVWYGTIHTDADYCYRFSKYLASKLKRVWLIIQVIFCHPPGSRWDEDENQLCPIRFNFSEQQRVSSTGTGENSVVSMVDSLYKSVELQFGALPTRLFRVFRPKPVNCTSGWRWRKLCCLPYVVVWIVMLVCMVAAIVLLIEFHDHLVASISSGSDTQNGSESPANIQYDDQDLDDEDDEDDSDYSGSDEQRVGAGSSPEVWVRTVLVSLGLVLGGVILANSLTFLRVLRALFYSHHRQVLRALRHLDSQRPEAYLEALKKEVQTMLNMVACLDSFTRQQTRLVVFVDGLDSCEQDKVLRVLDAVHLLFLNPNSPFIVILAIDPHVTITGIQHNIHRALAESNISGHEYLRNLVHLPFYLQNTSLWKVQQARKTAQQMKQKEGIWNELELDEVPLASFQIGRRLSTESSVSVRQRNSFRKRSLGPSDSVGSNINKAGTDPTRQLLPDDYFSDVNPRTMRRLLNVVYVMARLLKAFEVPFSWYSLIMWVHITEQWPFRTSWMINHYDGDIEAEDFEDGTALKSLYDRVSSDIPSSRDVEPLTELDRDYRKLEAFLTTHKGTILMAHLKVFLPFTINLDPYLRKVIKEGQQHFEEMNTTFQSTMMGGFPPTWNSRSPTITQDRRSSVRSQQGRKFSSNWGRKTTNPTLGRKISTPEEMMGMSHPMLMWPPYSHPVQQLEVGPHPRKISVPAHFAGAFDRIDEEPHPPSPPEFLRFIHSSEDLKGLRLSKMSVDEICDLLGRVETINKENLHSYAERLRDHNINGQVLSLCELGDLRGVLSMSFGDWELFRVLIQYLKEYELSCPHPSYPPSTSGNKNVRFLVPRVPEEKEPEEGEESENEEKEEEEEEAAKETRIAIPPSSPATKDVDARSMVGRSTSLPSHEEAMGSRRMNLERQRKLARLLEMRLSLN